MHSTPPMRAARPPLSSVSTQPSACSDALSTPDTLVGASTPPTSAGWLSPGPGGRLPKAQLSPHPTPALSNTASVSSVSPDPFGCVPSMPPSLLDDPYLGLSTAAAPSFNPFLPQGNVPFLSAAPGSQPSSADAGPLHFLLASSSAPISIPSAALQMSASVAPGLTESRTAPPAAFTVPSVENGCFQSQAGQPLSDFIRSWQDALGTGPSLAPFPAPSSSFPGATVNPSLRPFDLIDSPRVDAAGPSPWKPGDAEWGQPPATPGDACRPSSPMSEAAQSDASASLSAAPVDVSLPQDPAEPSKKKAAGLGKTTSSTLQHARTRSPVRKRDRDARFPCLKCGKVFTRNYNRLAHETIHEPDHPRPFVCPATHCKKAFARKYDARRHYRLHVVRDHAPPELVERIVDSRRTSKP